jgi:anhydro-N-acetylmuramic acid kinase
VRAIGLMSGTSLDGIDAALLDTDGETIVATGLARTVPYDPQFRERLRGALGKTEAPPEVVRELTEAHARAVAELLAKAKLPPRDVDVVGFHGHTIFHDPKNGVTRQIGDGALLARLTGIDIVNDFRSADVKAGGEGAPLVPLYHAALARDLNKPVAVLNLGGVANLTWIGADEQLLAFDTGPGVGLLDDWCARRAGKPFDEDGKLAGAGRADQTLVARMLEHPYFDRPAPKSLDRLDFGLEPVADLSAENGAATLCAFTAACVARGTALFPAIPRHFLVTGGGRRNPALMTALRRALVGAIEPVEKVGWDGDALEAQAFAFLAVRSLRGLPLSLPDTTGCKAPTPGGVRHPRPTEIG